MKKMLFIYNNPFGASYGGSLVTEKAYNALSQKYIVIKYYVDKPKNKFLTLLRCLFLFSGKMSLFDHIKIDRILKEDTDIEIVFFDVSLYGRAARMVKNKYPKIKVIINFHNNEAEFFYDLVKLWGSKYLLLWLPALYNEKLSCRNSDLNIFITEEDRKSVNAREVPSIIIPATLVDKFNPEKRFNDTQKTNYILFIGSASFGNLHAVQLLIEKIAPYISCNIIIAGKDVQAAVSKRKIPGNVIIQDYIGDLSEIYYGASAFVVPVYYGSGMKVKIAEAMMHGKKIIATPMAFYGYRLNPHSCSVCNTAEEFVAEINKLELSKTFYEESRLLFLKYYSASNNDAYYSQIDDYIKTAEV
jgi:glycosyltransferase involved in cell wall biosynthesis